jgi:integrase
MAWTEDLPPNKDGVVKVRGFYRLANGNKRSRTFTHKRAAMRWASAEEQKVIEGSRKDPAKGRMTLAAWYEKFWQTKVLEPGSVRSQVTLWRNHVEPRWGNVPLRDIERNDVQIWVNELRGKKKLSASTTRQAYYVLSGAMKGAVEANIIDSTPCMPGIMKLPRKPPAPKRYFTAKEIEALLTELPEPYRTLVIIMLETGMRIGEAAGLHWFRVDFDRRTVDIVEQWDSDDRIMKFPKSKKGRTVPMSDLLAETLKARWESREEWPLKCGFRHVEGSPCRSGLVVAGPRGAVIDRHNFRASSWQRALRKAKVSYAGTHTNRHTYASRLVTNGVSLSRVQELLGHGDIVTTQRYSHLQDDGFDEVRAALTSSWTKAEAVKDAESAPFLPQDQEKAD